MADAKRAKTKPSSAEAAATKICLTGGSGFLGSWCVKYLLDGGYTVHTTVRSADKAKYLQTLPGAAERLLTADRRGRVFVIRWLYV